MSLNTEVRAQKSRKNENALLFFDTVLKVIVIVRTFGFTLNEHHQIKYFSSFSFSVCQ